MPRIKLTWLYILFSPSFPLRYKIGITDRPVKERIVDIAYSIRRESGHNVKVFRFIQVPSLFAYRIEQRIHRLFARFQSPMPGSGKSEWFFLPNLLSAFLFLLALYYFDLGVSPAWCAVAALIPLPIDVALLLLFIAALESAFVLLVLAGFYHLLNYIVQWT